MVSMPRKATLQERRAMIDLEEAVNDSEGGNGNNSKKFYLGETDLINPYRGQEYKSIEDLP